MKTKDEYILRSVGNEKTEQTYSTFDAAFESRNQFKRAEIFNKKTRILLFQSCLISDNLGHRLKELGKVVTT